MAAGTGAANRAPRGTRLAGATRTAGSGAIDDLARTAGSLVDGVGKGERHLPYTLLGVLAIVLLGAIVVPLSIPASPPEPPREQALGEQFLLAWSAPGSPTVALGVTAPTLDEVTKAYGADGGGACTGTLGDAYDTLVTRKPGGRVAFDKAALAQMKVAHSVYCPERTAAFGKFVQRRAALSAQAAARTAT